MLGKFVLQDLPDEGVVTGGALASVVGDEEVVAQQDDRGEEVTDAGFVLVTLHQLNHSYRLKIPTVSTHKQQLQNKSSCAKIKYN